jgi:phosphohistidine phosphatase
VRHAHAEWPNYVGRDFDRPLTQRGLDDAHTSGAALREAGHKPDLILASPARRTRQTAEILTTELQLPPQALHFVDALYNAGPAMLEAELRRAQGERKLVMLVAHNPGVSELARRLAKDPLAPPFAPAQWRLLACPAA